jgi:hypothetical protein
LASTVLSVLSPVILLRVAGRVPVARELLLSASELLLLLARERLLVAGSGGTGAADTAHTSLIGILFSGGLSRASGRGTRDRGGRGGVSEIVLELALVRLAVAVSRAHVTVIVFGRGLATLG